MKGIIFGILLSLLPFFELRAGIPVLYASGLPLLWAFILGTLCNMLAFPITYLFLNYLHSHFKKIKRYEQFFQHFEEKYKKKIEHRIGTTWEYWALFLFVLIPLPGTGAYSGSFLAWLFKMNKKKAFLAVSGGVIGAGIIITLFMLGLITIF